MIGAGAAPVPGPHVADARTVAQQQAAHHAARVVVAGVQAVQGVQTILAHAPQQRAPGWTATSRQDAIGGRLGRKGPEDVLARQVFPEVERAGIAIGARRPNLALQRDPRPGQRKPRQGCITLGRHGDVDAGARLQHQP